MCVLLAFCFAATLGGVAHAQKHLFVVGAGAGSCAEYAEAYRGNPHEVDNFFLSWAQGYMSAANSLNKDVFLDLNAKRPDEMKRFLRQYCDAHPLADYKDGVQELLNTLPVVPDVAGRRPY